MKHSTETGNSMSQATIDKVNTGIRLNAKEQKELKDQATNDYFESISGSDNYSHLHGNMEK